TLARWVVWLPLSTVAKQRTCSISLLIVPGTWALQEGRTRAEFRRLHGKITQTARCAVRDSIVLLDLRIRLEVSPVRPRRRGTPGLAQCASAVSARAVWRLFPRSRGNEPAAPVAA